VERLAVEVYRKEPTNPAYVSDVRILNLQKESDAPGAARAMESLNVEQLQEPSIAAAYYDDYHNSHVRVASSMKFYAKQKSFFRGARLQSVLALGVKIIQAKKA
jgi:hypothetical protein